VHGARGWAVIYEPVEAVAVVSGKGLPFAGDGAMGAVEVPTEGAVDASVCVAGGGLSLAVPSITMASADERTLRLRDRCMLQERGDALAVRGPFKRSEVGGMLRFAPVAHSPSVRSTHRLPCLISCHERSLAIRPSLWRRNAGQKCSSQTNFGCGLLLRWLKRSDGWIGALAADEARAAANGIADVYERRSLLTGAE
jgi:hypothetical protein